MLAPLVHALRGRRAEPVHAIGLLAAALGLADAWGAVHVHDLAESSEDLHVVLLLGFFPHDLRLLVLLACQDVPSTKGRSRRLETA